MQLNVLNDLAKAKRRWTEKNFFTEMKNRCPRGSVGRASFLTALTDCRGGSIPCGLRVSLKTVDPPKGNGLGQKKKSPRRRMCNCIN